MTIGERKMVKQKQRWTKEEEDALIAGVGKHGQGKWKLIVEDPQFAPIFVNRTNIDLKDKWRNMNMRNVGSTSRERVTPPVSGLDLTIGPSDMLRELDHNLAESGVGSSNPRRVGNVLGFDLNLPSEPSSVLPPVEYGGMHEPSIVPPLSVYEGTPKHSYVLPLVGCDTPESSKCTVDRSGAPYYETVIYEALSNIQDPNGLDETTILNFIEERYEVPENYRRSISSTLQRLVLAGDLMEVRNRYMFKTVGQAYTIPMNVEIIDVGEDEDDTIGNTIPKGDANVVAHMIANSENMNYAAINTCNNADKLKELLEESMVMLTIAKDIHKRCKKEGVVVLNL